MVRYLLICALLTACGHSEQTSNQAETVAAQAHNYAVYMDGEYGYELAVSEDDKNAGKGANSVMLFKYLGERNGLHQLMHTESEGIDVVLECENPCKFIRGYTLVNKEMVRKEIIPANAGTIGELAMADAINGQLQQHVFGPEGWEHTMWYSNSRMEIKMAKDTTLSPQERQALGVGIEGAEKPEPVQAVVAEKPEEVSKYEMPTLQDMGIEDSPNQQQ